MTIDLWNQTTLDMGPWRSWLTDHGSLTRRLNRQFPDFNVYRLRQVIARPFFDEIHMPGLERRQPALIREVVLRNGTVPLVFAHTVIPLSSLRGPWQAVAGLGNRSLGSTLFANPRVQRFPLAFKRLDTRHPLYRSALRHLARPAKTLWARRSQFALAGHRLMVSEVFLPDLLSA